MNDVGLIQQFFTFMGKEPIAFLLLALSIGYPLGKVSIRSVSLGSTAGTLLVGVIIAIIAKTAFGLTYSIPGILSSLFLLFFMYALGLKVGPQFFSGIRQGGKAFITIGLIVWSLNWLICIGGAKLANLDPGFAAGLISGSYTVTAVLGVAQSAVDSGAYNIPQGMTFEQIGANMAAAYAVSYILSTIGIILLIRYLPKLTGHDSIADAKAAETAYSGGATHAMPGVSGALTLGFSPLDIRAYRVEHDTLIGKTTDELAKQFPNAPIMQVIRDGQVLSLETEITIQKNDIISVRADVSGLILEGNEIVGPEVDDPVARNIPLEAADIHIGAKKLTGKTLAELGKEIGYGVQLIALFRGGSEIPVGPNTEIRFGDVARISGAESSVNKVAKALGGKAILNNTTFTEVVYMVFAMLIGYLVGMFSVTIGGIPFALGSSAGCLLAGIFVSYFRSKNPEFGGPVSEGARSFLQDIGLNMFVAVLAANVGPKITDALHGSIVIWLIIIGLAGALIPPLVAYFIGIKFFKLNSIICDGACAGARNSTPSLNAIIEESKSSIAAVPYPVTYAITTVLVLIGGYIGMLLS